MITTLPERISLVDLTGRSHDELVAGLVAHVVRKHPEFARNRAHESETAESLASAVVSNASLDGGAIDAALLAFRVEQRALDTLRKRTRRRSKLQQIRELASSAGWEGPLRVAGVAPLLVRSVWRREYRSRSASIGLLLGSLIICAAITCAFLALAARPSVIAEAVPRHMADGADNPALGLATLVVGQQPVDLRSPDVADIAGVRPADASFAPAGGQKRTAQADIELTIGSTAADPWLRGIARTALGDLLIADYGARELLAVESTTGRVRVAQPMTYIASVASRDELFIALVPAGELLRIDPITLEVVGSAKSADDGSWTSGQGAIDIWHQVHQLSLTTRSLTAFSRDLVPLFHWRSPTRNEPTAIAADATSPTVYLTDWSETAGASIYGVTLSKPGLAPNEGSAMERELTLAGVVDMVAAPGGGVIIVVEGGRVSWMRDPFDGPHFEWAGAPWVELKTRDGLHPVLPSRVCVDAPGGRLWVTHDRPSRLVSGFELATLREASR